MPATENQQKQPKSIISTQRGTPQNQTHHNNHKDCNPKTKKEQNPQQKLLPTKKTTESPTTTT